MHSKLITAGVVLLFAAAVAWWHLYTPARGLREQLPGADNRPPESARKANEVRIGEFFMRYADTSSALTGSWPAFRGPDGSNILNTRTAFDFAADSAFRIAWTLPTGEGHAAPAIRNGRVYLLDYDETLSSDALRCLDLATGRELWRRWYRVPMKRNHGFSRTVPALTEESAVTIGPQGHVMCCSLQSGDLLWTLDMARSFGAEVPFWYTGQCPLVDGNTLVLAPAGDSVLMLGVDCATGRIAWQTPNRPRFKMSHSSVVPMRIGGQRTYVYVGIGGVCGVSAEGSDAGRLLWTATSWQPSVVAPSPVRLSDSQIFLSAGYGTGGALLSVERSGARWSARIVEQYKSNKGIASEQQTPILYNGRLIAIMPKDGGSLRDRLVVHSPSDLHNPLWASAGDERLGLGPYFVLNSTLLALRDDGELFIYRIEPTRMSLIRRLRLFDGEDAWGSMACADGYLLARDAHRLVCVRL